jgi:ribosomal protein S18 acetylase RimI-like enzyme
MFGSGGRRDRELVIRAGTGDDIEAVRALWREADVAPSATDDAASLRRLVAHDPGALFVAEIEGVLVATVVATFDGWRGNMYRLAVASEYRRAGVATALVEAGESRLRARGCRRITALVIGDHDHATGFWTAAGYDWQPEIRRYVR